MSFSKSLILGSILAGIFGSLTYFVGIRGPVFSRSTDIGAVSRGQAAPPFTLSNMEGKEVSLEDFQGKLILLNFWASWCQPCLDEMPSLQKLHDLLQSDGFMVLAINLNETNEDLNLFLKQNGISFPILVEGQEVSERYGTEKVPESYLIDQRGIVLQKIIGAQNWLNPEVVQYLKQLLQNS